MEVFDSILLELKMNKLIMINALNAPQQHILNCTLIGIRKSLDNFKIIPGSIKNIIFSNNSYSINFGLWRIRFSNICYLYIFLSTFFIKRDRRIVFDNPIINRNLFGFNTLTKEKPTGTPYVRLGLGSPLGDGIFPISYDKSRWDYFKNTNNIRLGNISNYKKNDKVLIVGQKLFDGSVGSIDFFRPIIIWLWLIKYAFICRKYKEIVFSTHPLSKLSKTELMLTKIIKLTAKLFKNLSITDDSVINLVKNNRFNLCVTYSSGACFDATISGIPLICSYKKSMGYGFYPKNYKEYLNYEYTDKKRLDWLCWLSYTEWTVSEIKNGIPFKFYKITK